jgi:very-short-patch-repair endonuclease
MSKVPWPEIVKFHAEIVKRMERSFFAFDPWQSASDRWTSLDRKIGCDLAGPWQITPEQLRSKPFRLASRAKQHETLFLGGPCYRRIEKTQNGSTDKWQPILYREVELRHDDDGWELVPKEGAWSVSPLLLSGLASRETIAPADLEQLGTRLIEKVVHFEDEPEPVTAALLNLCPDARGTISQDLMRMGTERLPSPWVLFAPITSNSSYSALTRYLMNDYTAMSAALSEPDPNLGGLRVLEGDPWQPISDNEPLLPLVPLNDRQKVAVETMLRGDPLTVISGPPGCGKSQVVVSLLLNAWARGMSVLFASNNNKAVDVVRERLERFEREVPIAVRAGNREANKVSVTLKQVINAAAMQSGTPFGITGTPNDRKAKLATKAKIQELLDTKVPQRIDEALGAAFRGYSSFQEMVSTIEAKDAEFMKRLQQLGVAGWKSNRIRSALEMTRAWVASLPAAVDRAASDERLWAHQQSAISEYRTIRDATVQAVGLAAESVRDWTWLLNGPGELERWVTSTTALLGRPLEQELIEPEWNPEFDRWASESQIINWEQNARALLDRVQSTRVSALAVQVELAPRKEAVDLARKEITDAGVPAQIEVRDELLAAWSDAFVQVATMPERMFDWLPWSRRRTLQRQLERVESELRAAFPIRLWLELGPLDSATRKKLSETVTRTRAWLHARLDSQRIAEAEASVTRSYAQLRKELSALAPELIPTGDTAADWAAVAEGLQRLIELSRTAAAANSRWELAARTCLECTNLFGSWSTRHTAVPLIAAWRAGDGADLDGAICKFAERPTPDLVPRLRQGLCSGSLQSVIRAWQAALNTELAAVQAERTAASIEREPAHRSKWFTLKPADCLIRQTHQDEWPSREVLEGLLEIPASLLTEWLAYDSSGRAELQGECDTRYTEARSKLVQASQLLRKIPDAPDTGPIVSLTLKSRSWPDATIQSTFSFASPDLLKATVERIESELERSSFSAAKASWLERVRTDRAAQEALHHLHDVFDRNSGQIAREHAAAFRKGLSLVPIWITTAQAAQAIPLDPGLFDLVVIDEASQCTLTNLLPLLYRGKRLAVIGDSQQLPAIPAVQEVEEGMLAGKLQLTSWLSRFGHVRNDVFETARRMHPAGPAATIMLTDHYRSHPQIIGFVNRYIYQSSLSLKSKPPGVAAAGVFMVPVHGRASKNGWGWINQAEADSVVKLVEQLQADGAGSIGVVSPFTGQVNLITSQLEQSRIENVVVRTAHGFQGDERDVMIFSPVVAPGIKPGATRFAEEPPNLVNVALTRAREAVYVVADFSFLKSQTGILKDLASYCESIELLRKASATELLLYSWMLLDGLQPTVHPVIADMEVDFTLNQGGIRLAIEVDGSTHSSTKTADAARDATLRGRGYKVERFTGSEVMHEPHECLERIRQALRPA